MAALSYGNLISGKSMKNVPLSFGYPVGDTRNDKSVYDDAILRAARTRTAGQPNAKAATNRLPLSFGSTVPKYSDPFASGERLTYGPKVEAKGNTTSFLPKVSDFLSFASFGMDAGDTRSSAPQVYDDGILRASRAVEPIPKVNTGTIDGGTSMLSTLKDLARASLANMGSSGDGEMVTQASFVDDGGGINPLWVAGAAVAAGVLYYAYAK